MNALRIYNRFVFHTKKFFIKSLSFFNHRLYMKMLLPLLESNGMHLNGVPRFIGSNVVFDDIDLITLGDRVVISEGCHFLTHDYSITTALIAVKKKPMTDVALIRGITVGNNVFIGMKSLIMPDTIIGDDVIIGAGSVVRGKIPSNSIVVGNPGKIVGLVSEQALKWEKYLDSEFVRYD